MTPAQQQQKLTNIASLTLGELLGWREYIRSGQGQRNFFPGELAALATREQELRK